MPPVDGGSEPRTFLLMVAENELVRKNKKLKLTAQTLDELLELVAEQLKLPADTPIAISKQVKAESDAVPYASLDDIPDKAKVQVWPRSKFELETPRTKKMKQEMKLVLLGDCRVGKSCLVRCLLRETSGAEDAAEDGSYKPTVGMEHQKISLTLGDEETGKHEFKLQVWDREGKSTYGVRAPPPS